MGGRMVTELAADNPERALSVILLDAIVGETWDKLVTLFRTNPFLLGWIGAVLAVDSVATVPLLRDPSQAMKLARLTQGMVRRTAVNPLRLAGPGLSIIRSTPSKPLLEQIRRKGIPLMAIHGDRDIAVPLSTGRSAARHRRRAAGGGRGRHALVAAEGPRDVPGDPPGDDGQPDGPAGSGLDVPQGRRRPPQGDVRRPRAGPSTSLARSSTGSPRRSTRTGVSPRRACRSSIGTSRTSTSSTTRTPRRRPPTPRDRPEPVRRRRNRCLWCSGSRLDHRARTGTPLLAARLRAEEPGPMPKKETDLSEIIDRQKAERHRGAPPPRQRHRLPRGAGCAADQADQPPQRAPQGPQEGPPQPPRPAPCWWVGAVASSTTSRTTTWSGTDRSSPPTASAGSDALGERPAGRSPAFSSSTCNTSTNQAGGMPVSYQSPNPRPQPLAGSGGRELADWELATGPPRPERRRRAPTRGATWLTPSPFRPPSPGPTRP